MNAAALSFFVFCLYAFGCATSQSLMSVGGIALLLLALPRLRRLDRVLLASVCIWILFTGLNLLLREPAAWHERAIRNLPLFLLPILAPALPWDGRRRQWILWSATAGLVAALCAALWQSGRGVPAVGFFGNPIYFAYALLPAFVFMGEAAIQNLAQRRVALLGFAAASLAILLSGIRGIWLCMAAYLALRVLPELWRKPKFLLTSLLLIVVAALGAYHTQPYVREKLQRSFSGQDASWTSRGDIWLYNWQLFLEHPLTGVGAARNMYRPEPGAPGLVEGFDYYAHNAYLQMLAEGGLIGAFLLLAYFLLLAQKAPSTRWVLLLSAFAAFTENTLNNSKALHPFLFYLLLSQLFAGESKTAEQNQQA